MHQVEHQLAVDLQKICGGFIIGPYKLQLHLSLALLLASRRRNNITGRDGLYTALTDIRDYQIGSWNRSVCTTMWVLIKIKGGKPYPSPWFLNLHTLNKHKNRTCFTLELLLVPECLNKYLIHPDQTQQKM